jgi:hypothetical protein
MKTITIPFILTNHVEGKLKYSIKISIVAVVRFQLLNTSKAINRNKGNKQKLAANIMSCFRKTVTRWLKETSVGKTAYKQSGKDFNIGDLVIYENDFRSWATAYGITNFKIIFEEPREFNESLIFELEKKCLKYVSKYYTPINLGISLMYFEQTQSSGKLYRLVRKS